MGVNKVEINGETKLDLTQDTVTPETLLPGVTAHNAAGDEITGAAPVVRYDEAQNLTDAQKEQARDNIGAGAALEFQEITADEVRSAWDSYPPVCLTFSAPSAFSISVETPGWDGTMEYSTDKFTWDTWDGSEISAVDDGGTYALYLRGSGNTKTTGINGSRWNLTGSDIVCDGNIESLLDYAAVVAGNHPEMAAYCYYGMFQDCTSLTTAPALPATTLANGCYDAMFYNCASLTVAPALPATTLDIYCYYIMFYGCTSLTTAPALPATTLANGCYDAMFRGCASLTVAPALPATTLAENCYNCMFAECTSLKLSATQAGNYTQAYRIPTSGTGTTDTDSLTDMFLNTGGTFTGTPEVNTTYYLDASNTIV